MQDAEVTKVSINAYGHGLRDRYVLLRAGGAAGFGVGPIVVATSQRAVGGRIAIPGERTTAALLLRQLGTLRHGRDAVRSDRGRGASRRCRLRRADSRGPLHVPGEGPDAARRSRQVWEQRMHCPLPLAAIAIRRDLAPTLAPAIDRALARQRRIRVRASRRESRLRRRARAGDGSRRDASATFSCM